MTPRQNNHKNMESSFDPTVFEKSCYERDGEFYVLTHSEAHSRYREKIRLMTTALIWLKNVTVITTTSPSEGVTRFTVIHNPTQATVRATVIKEKPDGKRRYEKTRIEVDRYSNAIRTSLWQEIANYQGRQQICNPNYVWVKYTLLPEI
jgi:hypothetical protein